MFHIRSFFDRTDCGIFMLKFLELWNGSMVPAISQEEIPALRKVLTALWWEHPGNKVMCWRYLLDKFFSVVIYTCKPCHCSDMRQFLCTVNIGYLNSSGMVTFVTNQG